MANRRISFAELGLIDYWKIVWSRRLTVFLIAVFSVMAIIGIDSTRTRVYTATASMIFVLQNTSLTGATRSLSPQDIATQVSLFNSSEVRNQAKHILGVPAPAISVVSVPGTVVVNVSVSSSDPQFAAKAANAYVASYIAFTEKSFIAQDQTLELSLQNQITNLQNRINLIQQQISKSPASQSAPLYTQIAALQVQNSIFESQLSQVQFSMAQAPSGGRLVTPATVPTHPVSPVVVVDALIALGLALAVGVILALILEFLDDRIKTQSDLEEVSRGIPVLGIIPQIKDWRKTKTTLLVTRSLPLSPSAEAYRVLRTSIQFASFDESISIIEVTSPSLGDGKTTTAANLSVSLAESGKRVVLVGCDLRRPRIHEFFGLSNDVGFTSVLLGETNVMDACVQVEGLENLWLLPSGPIALNPSEVIGSSGSRDLFEELKNNFDLVIVDTAPILPVTDAVVLATIADAVLVVCAANISTCKDFNRALDLLDRVEAPVFGVILNVAIAVDAYAYYLYGESYGYGYGEGSSSRSSKRSRRFVKSLRGLPKV